MLCGLSINNIIKEVIDDALHTYLSLCDALVVIHTR